MNHDQLNEQEKEDEPIEFNQADLKAWLLTRYKQASEGTWVYKTELQERMFGDFDIGRNYHSMHRTGHGNFRALFPKVTEARRGDSRNGYRPPAYKNLVLNDRQ